MSQITVIVKKAVDRYHRVGIAFDVPDDQYHRGLVKLGALVVVEETKPAPTPPAAPETKLTPKPKPKSKRKPSTKTGKAKG